PRYQNEPEAASKMPDSCRERRPCRPSTRDTRAIANTSSATSSSSLCAASCAITMDPPPFIAGLIALGHVATEEQSNEITAIPELLKQIDLANTIDAMGCQ